VYEDQWVERRIRVGRQLLQPMWDSLGNLLNMTEDDLNTLCNHLAQIYVAWNLEGEDGPLPEPWGNPDAFLALADSDLALFDWVGATPFAVSPTLDHQKTDHGGGSAPHGVAPPSRRVGTVGTGGDDQ